MMADDGKPIEVHAWSEMKQGVGRVTDRSSRDRPASRSGKISGAVQGLDAPQIK